MTFADFGPGTGERVVESVRVPWPEALDAATAAGLHVPDWVRRCSAANHRVRAEVREKSTGLRKGGWFCTTCGKDRP